MAGINLGGLIETIVDDATAYELDSVEIAAGQNVEAPGHLQVGTSGGKPVYLFGILTTNAEFSPSGGAPVVKSSPGPTSSA